METASLRPGKKNFGSGQLIFENWSGGPVESHFTNMGKKQSHVFKPITALIFSTFYICLNFFCEELV